MIANAGVAINRVLHESKHAKRTCATLLALSTSVRMPSADGGARQAHQHQHQGHLLLVQVRRHSAHRAGHRWAHRRRRVHREQEGSVSPAVVPLLLVPFTHCFAFGIRHHRLPAARSLLRDKVRGARDDAVRRAGLRQARDHRERVRPRRDRHPSP